MKRKTNIGYDSNSSEAKENPFQNIISGIYSDNEILYNQIQTGNAGMSFVGISCVAGNIYVFSDTKRTKIGDDGNLMEDIEKGPIKKQFITDDFAIVFSGGTEIKYYDKYNMPVEIDVSHWIESNIDSVDNPINLICKLYLFAQAKECLFQPIYIGAVYKRNYQFADMISLVNAVISPDEIKCNSEAVTNNEIYLSGEKEYVSYFSAHSDELLICDKDSIKENVQKRVEEMDRLLKYNPVGGNIVIKQFAK